MQGPSHLDLARTLADDYLKTTNDHKVKDRTQGRHAIRHRLGQSLIRIGETLTPKPAEFQLKADTGRPCS